MTPEEITAAANALVTATQDTAVASGQNIEAAQGQLAPGLVTGSNAPGGYNYARNVAPTVPALTATFVTNAKQAALRGAIRDAIYGAQSEYDAAKSGYQTRQRTFQQNQAERARQRQAEADARQRKYDEMQAATVAAQTALSRGGGSYGVGGVDVVGTGGKATMAPKNGRDGTAGYNFTDSSGKPISAATFARLMNVNFNDLLTQMARSGDRGAARVMSGSDTSKEYTNFYRALTWK